MDRSQVILLLKYPEKGEVKSRLGRQLGEELVVGLYRNFILDMLSTLEGSGVRYSLSFYPPRSLVALREWLGPSRYYFPQRGSDHPERLMNTFLDAFSRGEERVVVLASDVPDITKEVIIEGIRSLERNDAVVGPSPDGGYYLIGFRRDAFLPEAFRGVAWSTSQALSDTLSRMRDLTVHHLPFWPDIDMEGDLHELVRCDRNPLFRGSRTMAFLKDAGLAGL